MAGNSTEKAYEKAATPLPALSLPGNEISTLNMAVAAAEGNGDPSNDQMPPYSVFNRAQKRIITWQTSLSAVFSGLSSFIYYPTITALSESLHVSVAAINLTVAAYLIVAGIAPSVFGDISDQTGRRPVSLLTITLYFAANIGLAIQNSYTALVALRCLQSAGSAATIAIAHGVISDITTPAERGYYVGILFGFTNAAPSLGPVIGGAITKYLSWHWVFWLLSILSGCQLGNLLIFFPETLRKLVGNGSTPASYWPNKSIFSIYKARKNHQQRQDMRSSPAANSNRTRGFLNAVPNPLSCLRTMFQKGNSILISVGAIHYAIYSVLGTSISTEMAELYGLNPLLSGLLYLPSGIGGLIASLQTGRLLDYQYKVVARSLEASTPPSISSNHSPTTLPTSTPPVSASPSQPNDLYAFPIERARLRAMAPFLLISSFSTLGYGWSLHYKAHIAVPLLMQLLSGSTQVAIFVIIGTLLTDFNPGRSSTAQAAYSMVRCDLAAGGVAALRPLVESVGVGWCFTIATGASVLCAPLLVGLWLWGWGWRRERRERDEERVVGR